MVRLYFEDLFINALSALIEKCGGNIEIALDSISHNKEEREEIKKLFNWNEEEYNE